jgi:hypothetical protein
MMKKMLLLYSIVGGAAFAQVMVPDGTKVRLRLDQSLSSATAAEGQTVELSVTDAIRVDGVTVVAEGARATGTVIVAQEKRRMGRAGKLDFSVDRVRAVNGDWLPVRYTINKKSGNSKAVSTGVITAGVAVVFWPAAPFVLLRRGKDIDISKGVTFDVFVDGNHSVGAAPPAPAQVTSAAPAVRPPVQPPPGGMSMMQVAAPAAPVAPGAPQPPSPQAGEAAAVTVNSTEPGSDIEINGSFVGNTPTVLKLAPGQYTITVRHGAQVWQRVLTVTAGGAITLNANFEPTAMPVAQRRR